MEKRLHQHKYLTQGKWHKKRSEIAHKCRIMLNCMWHGSEHHTKKILTYVVIYDCILKLYNYMYIYAYVGLQDLLSFFLWLDGYRNRQGINKIQKKLTFGIEYKMHCGRKAVTLSINQTRGTVNEFNTFVLDHNNTYFMFALIHLNIPISYTFLCTHNIIILILSFYISYSMLI